VSFFKKNKAQDDFYNELIRNRRGSHFFSCGYSERFDPFLLDQKPFLAGVYESLFNSLFPDKVTSILDVGCGTGLYWPVLARYGDDISGIDSSESMIDEAKRLVAAKSLSHIKPSVQNSGDIQFPDASFDVVLCVDALHHIPQLRKAVDEFHRVLKPEGRFLAVEPNMFNPLMFLAHLIPPEERYGVVRSFAPILRSVFRSHFENIQVRYVNYVASATSKEQLQRVESLGNVLVQIPLLRSLSLRQTLSMTKRFASALPSAGGG
jgi:ubiquinone/menaquinone biosynthesis C-methylase UbiE